eukprot:764433-Hanusia_phi.AAC.4
MSCSHLIVEAEAGDHQASSKYSKSTARRECSSPESDVPLSQRSTTKKQQTSQSRISQSKTESTPVRVMPKRSSAAKNKNQDRDFVTLSSDPEDDDPGMMKSNKIKRKPSVKRNQKILDWLMLLPGERVVRGVEA